ncbi:hypothetical protein D3879_14690 [Pseudomonas cavernicola]|uniref:Phage head morphogenesis domain-containing protein n=1 Tax=Pseudomonas cavernicola TaxID=2320866 RepID=A0A418XEG6_9PSED|nr:phage minor head protein [Pseudomonas cavernicola]RJG10924.1 hypothetical protein D3879_14690 [Pseudomonas cavernicola]
MASANQVIEDEGIAHAVSLQQYSLGVVQRMVSLLNRVDAELSAALLMALEQMPAESFSVERMELLLGSVRSINAQAYALVAQELQKDLNELAGYESQWQYDLFERLMPDPVKVRFPIARVSAEQVYAAAMSRPFQGRLLRDWAGGIEADRMTKIRNIIRNGYVEGKTTADIVRQVRGTRAASYADSLINRSRHDLESVVRTAISHTASTARAEFNKANEALIKAVKWLSTLDSHTTKEICVPRDGKLYSATDHKPIGHVMKWLQGPGRAHWNCRSTETPITKSWKELGIPLEEMSPGERASMDGQVPADTTYMQWLARQSAARQDQVLGPERGKLLREGGLSVEDFYTPTGRFLSIAELKGRDAEAFERLEAA